MLHYPHLPKEHLLSDQFVSEDRLLQWLTTCETQLAQQPTAADLLQQRSYYLARLGRYPDAISSYQKTLAIAPSDPKVWCNYGSTLAAAGYLPEAINAYDRALDITPDYANAWRRRGRVLHRMGEYARAIESYDQALALAPTDDRLWYRKGLAVYRLQQVEQAINYFKIAIENNRENRQAHLCLIYILITANCYQEAIQRLEPLLQRGWADADLYHCHAYALQRQGQLAAALKQLEQAICLDPQKAHRWFHKGLLQTRLKQFAKAHQSFRESLKRQADHTDSWLALGMTLRQLAMHEEAIAAFNKALAITPNHPLAFYHQACCYAAIGRTDWAMEHLRRAISLDGDTYLSRSQNEPILTALVN